MAYTYIGLELWACDQFGNRLPGVEVRVFTGDIGEGLEVTALQDLTGISLSGRVTSDAKGLWYWVEPSQAWPTLWIQPPVAPGETVRRYPVSALELTPGIGTAITQAAAANALASEAINVSTATAVIGTAAQTRSLEALSTADSALTLARSALNTAGAPADIADIPYPWIIGHRGMANVVPENTLDGWRALISVDAPVALETDVYLLRDGGTACMHDSTLTRTTNGTGNTALHTSASIRRYRVDGEGWFLPGTPSVEIPTFDQFCQEFGGQRILCPEAKNVGSGAAIAATLVRYGLTRSALVQSFTQAELTPAITAGIECMLVASTGTGIDFVALANSGIRWVGLGTVTAAQVIAAHAAEVRVVVYTVDRRQELAALLAIGVDGVYSNDPLYLGGFAPRLTTDPFVSQTYYHGHLGAPRNANIGWPRGKFDGSTGLVLDSDAETGTSMFVMQGWGSPIKGDPEASDFTINANIRFDAVDAATRWFCMFIADGSDLDRQYGDAGGNADGNPDGYAILWRLSGEIEVYRFDADPVALTGVATLLASVTTTTPFVIGTARQVRLVVTPTTLTASVPTAGAVFSVTATSSTYRGGYFHFGSSQAQVTVSAVAIT